MNAKRARDFSRCGKNLPHSTQKLPWDVREAKRSPNRLGERGNQSNGTKEQRENNLHYFVVFFFVFIVVFFRILARKNAYGKGLRIVPNSGDGDAR